MPLVPRTLPPTANEITTELLLRVSKELPDVWLWRNNRFIGKAVGAGGKVRHVSAGIDGQGDLSGLATVTANNKKIAVRVELEVKTHNDRVRPTQEAFGRKIQRMGGIYFVVRDVDEAIQEMKDRLCQLI